MFETGVPINAVPDVFESNALSTGMEQQTPGGVTIQLSAMPMQKRHLPGLAELFTITVSGLTGVGLNLFSSYIYDKLKKRGVREITVSRRILEVTPEGLRRKLEETITVKEG